MKFGEVRFSLENSFIRSQTLSSYAGVMDFSGLANLSLRCGEVRRSEETVSFPQSVVATEATGQKDLGQHVIYERGQRGAGYAAKN